MFSIEISIPDLDRVWIHVTCPRCRLTTPVALRSVRTGDVVVCRGCHMNLILRDHLGSYHEAKRSFERALSAFGR